METKDWKDGLEARTGSTDWKHGLDIWHVERSDHAAARKD
jgi:hypothetical protein